MVFATNRFRIILLLSLLFGATACGQLKVKAGPMDAPQGGDGTVLGGGDHGYVPFRIAIPVEQVSSIYSWDGKSKCSDKLERIAIQDPKPAAETKDPKLVAVISDEGLVARTTRRYSRPSNRIYYVRKRAVFLGRSELQLELGENGQLRKIGSISDQSGIAETAGTVAGAIVTAGGGLWAASLTAASAVEVAALAAAAASAEKNDVSFMEEASELTPLYLLCVHDKDVNESACSTEKGCKRTITLNTQAILKELPKTGESGKKPEEEKPKRVTPEGGSSGTGSDET